MYRALISRTCLRVSNPERFFSVLLLSTRSGFFSVAVSINPPNAAPGTERGILMREHESCLKWMNEWMIRLMTANSGNILFEKQMSWHVRPIYYRTRNCFRIYYSKSMRSFEPSLNRISNLFFDGGIFKGKYHHVVLHSYILYCHCAYCIFSSIMLSIRKSCERACLNGNKDVSEIQFNVSRVFIFCHTHRTYYIRYIRYMYQSIPSIHVCVCVCVSRIFHKANCDRCEVEKKKLISFQLNVNPENMSTEEQQYILTAGADIYIYISLWGQRTRINRKLRWTKMVMTCRFSDLNRVSIQISTTKIQCTHRGNLVATPTDRIYFQSKPHSPNTYLWILE